MRYQYVPDIPPPETPAVPRSRDQEFLDWLSRRNSERLNLILPEINEGLARRGAAGCWCPSVKKKRRPNPEATTER